MQEKEFREILKNNNLKLKDFSELINTSYQTVAKWGKYGRDVPSWVEPFLNLYIRNKELEELKDGDYEKYKTFAKALQGVMSEEK